MTTYRETNLSKVSNSRHISISIGKSYSLGRNSDIFIGTRAWRFHQESDSGARGMRFISPIWGCHGYMYISQRIQRSRQRRVRAHHSRYEPLGVG